MGISDIAVQPVDEGNSESTVRFLIEWVSDGEAEARSYLADHAEPDGASFIATDGPDAIGYVAIVWESNYAGFRSRGIPLVHQIAVAGPFLRQGVATLLMGAAEELVRDRGIATPVEAVDQARDHFYLAARENLGVHGGSVAQFPFLRARERPAPSGFGDSTESSDRLSSSE